MTRIEKKLIRDMQRIKTEISLLKGTSVKPGKSESIKKQRLTDQLLKSRPH